MTDRGYKAKSPLLWELDDVGAPDKEIIAPNIVDELEASERQQKEVFVGSFEASGAAVEETTSSVVEDDEPDLGYDESWLGGPSRPQDDGPTLFEIDRSWKDLWKQMPEFEQRDLSSYQSVLVHFRDERDRATFSALVGQKITERTKSLWFPKAEIVSMLDKRFVTSAPAVPRYPVYVISKGRWESRLTSRSLEAINVPYNIVIEPQEYEQYAAVIDPSKIIVLPFSNLGQGSIPARNFVWEHALGRGAARHWILDDNIDGFYRLYQNLKTPVATGATFLAAEDFSDRFENVAISGFNYFMFGFRKHVRPPFTLNTRIYSCILINNAIPLRWRGRYNEDTDLSIRALKAGWCTVLFNAFLADKKTTMTMRGGNTDELYKDNGRLLMAESLREQHPDVVVVTEKWGRPQHHVDYHRFSGNKLKPRSGITIDDRIDNYGMYLDIDAPKTTQNGPIDETP